MRTRVSSLELVGRDEEAAELAARLDRAAAGEPGVVLVGGESGVGKSRLVAELVSRATRGGMTALVGDCVDLSGSEVPYAPFAVALGRLARGMDEERLGELLGPVSGELARLFPELAGPAGRAAASGDAAASGQAHVFELVLGLLDRLSQDAPVLLVVEDLHWADRSTRDLLGFLARSVRHERLLLVLTYRSDELHRRHPLRPFLADLDRAPRVQRLVLERLTREQVMRQLELIVGAPLPASTVDAIYERGEGNPFYTEELLAATAEGRDAVLPETVADALLLRFEQLSPAAQEVVRVAAAAGRRAQHGLIAAVAGLPERELLDALREAVGRHVLVHHAEDGSYGFRHALLREAVYGDLLPGERTAVHRALAEALAADQALAGRRTAVWAELAFHWYAAHELELALTASIRAGREAERVYAFAEAARDFERALEIWDQVSPAEPELDRPDLLLHAAEAALRTGQAGRASALAAAAVQLVDERAEPVRAALALKRLARYRWIDGRAADAMPLYRRAVEVMPADPSPERAEVIAAEAQMLMLHGRPEESRVLCEEALAIARQVGARAVEANVLNTLVACAGASTGDLDAALDWAQEARSIAEEIGSFEELSRAFVNGSDALEQAGRVEEALDLALEGAERARGFGSERSSGYFLRAEAAGRMIRLGRWDEAAEELAELGRAATEGLTILLVHALQAKLLACRGDFAAAEEAAARAQAVSRRVTGSMWLAGIPESRALAALWQDEPGAALEQVQAATRSFSSDQYVFYTAPVHWLGVGAAADLAERARAGRDSAGTAHAVGLATAELERLDSALATAYGRREPPPPVAAYRALAAAEHTRARGDHDPDAWDDAAARFDRIGQVYEAAYARLRGAEAVLGAGGSAPEAAQRLRAAHATAQRLGAEPLTAAVEALARRGRIALADEPRGAPPSGADRLGLTPRELEVLLLVAEGLTNRQIGEHLYMSEKTASVHVSRILAKLDVANRAEAAAAAHRLRLVPLT